MRTSVKRNEKGLFPVLSVSLILHLTVYGLFAWLQIFPSAKITDAPVYYVDMVNLPVESPQQGLPSPESDNKEAAPPQPVKPPAAEMKLPSKNEVKSTSPERGTKPAVIPKTSHEENSREFEERMAKLEKASDARHEAAAMEAIRKRTSARGKTTVGIPGGTGTEAGSDYAAFIRSRLVDAFKTTIAYQEKSPRVVMVLTIDRNGRVMKRRIENSTGDRIFEDAVNRAVIKAERNFTPPPGGGTFEYGFIFTAQGVGKN